MHELCRTILHDTSCSGYTLASALTKLQRMHTSISADKPAANTRYLGASKRMPLFRCFAQSNGRYLTLCIFSTCKSSMLRNM
jgi:hypothetical protein